MCDETKEFTSKLKTAVGSGDVKTVRRLVKGGINVNAMHNSWYKTSILHEAVSTGSREMVALLIQAKADVNAVNEDKRSALHLAARSGKTEIIQELIKAGANLNARTSDGRTALHIALWRGKPEVIHHLVEAGANINIQDEDGWSPLYWAAKLNYIDVSKMLVKNGAKLNARNKRGLTPFHIAIINGHFDMAKFLIHEGADLNIKVQGNSFVSMLLQNKCLQCSRVMDVLNYGVQHGFNLRNDSTVLKGTLLKRFQHDEKFHLWLESVEKHVDSLSCICRVHIRTHLSKCGQSVKPIINQLPLPKLLISFLTFDNNHELT